MNIVIWIVFGALAGWIASLIMGTNAEQGAIANIAIGIVGALIGGFVVQLVGGSGVTGFNPMSLIIAIVGAVILLWAMKFLSRATN
ncbi:MAG: GlsB/YeaQ/YmgE family stress response membrane protein [Candidatus Saccharimonadales bacterium]